MNKNQNVHTKKIYIFRVKKSERVYYLMLGYEIVKMRGRGRIAKNFGTINNSQENVITTHLCDTSFRIKMKVFEDDLSLDP